VGGSRARGVLIQENVIMELQLSNEQAGELRSLLDATFRDLTHEISATDNAEYRAGLRGRRDLLATIRSQLDEATETIPE
ncbi:MAG TPA: hypothetical protein VED63_07050, partial [Acidimicrobiales bacterium]|nr:hypothetical protein [Acidimicrobiales bacterium]